MQIIIKIVKTIYILLPLIKPIIDAIVKATKDDQLKEVWKK